MAENQVPELWDTFPVDLMDIDRIMGAIEQRMEHYEDEVNAYGQGDSSISLAFTAHSHLDHRTLLCESIAKLTEICQVGTSSMVLI